MKRSRLFWSLGLAGALIALPWARSYRTMQYASSSVASPSLGVFVRVDQQDSLTYISHVNMWDSKKNFFYELTNDSITLAVVDPLVPHASWGIDKYRSYRPFQRKVPSNQRLDLSDSLTYQEVYRLYRRDSALFKDKGF